MRDSERTEYWLIGNASEKPHQSLAIQHGTADPATLMIYSSRELAEAAIARVAERDDNSDHVWQAVRLSRTELIRLLEYAVGFFEVFRCCQNDGQEYATWCRTFISELRIGEMQEELKSILSRAERVIPLCRALRDSATDKNVEKADQLMAVAETLQQAIDDTIARNEVGFDSEEDLQLCLNFLNDWVCALERAFEHRDD